MNLKEHELAMPVNDWLATRGYTVYAEVPVFQENVDMVGIKEDENKLISIELKTGWNNKLLRQVQYGLLWADEVYACTPRNPSNKTMAWFNHQYNTGIGILKVSNNVVEVLRPGKGEPNLHIKTKTIELLKHLTPGWDTAGKPCLKGCGPCQDVIRGIAEYRKINPKATWKELFENVPNHYRTHQNMYSAIRSNDIRRAYRESLKKPSLLRLQ